MANGIFGNGSVGSVVDVVAFMDSKISTYIAELVSMGCLVSIGGSRDGGAISLNVLYEGDSTRQWFRTDDAAIEWLADVRAQLVAAGATPRATPAPPVQRRRRGASKDL